MTEVMNPDGSPHVSNHRAEIDDDDNDFWFGFEQEYFLMDTETDLPLDSQRWIPWATRSILLLCWWTLHLG